VPGGFQVEVTEQRKYACRRCQTGVVIGPLPVRMLDAVLPGPGLLAEVLCGNANGRVEHWRGCCRNRDAHLRMTNQAGMIWNRWSLGTRDILYVGCSASLGTPWGGMGMSEYEPRQGERTPDRALLHYGGLRKNAAHLSFPAPLRAVSPGARSPGGIFIRSESAHWQGRHNNLTEQRIRPVALGRRNFLFVGSDAGAPSSRNSILADGQLATWLASSLHGPIYTTSWTSSAATGHRVASTSYCHNRGRRPGGRS